MNDLVKDTASMALIGDGILSLLRPKRHVWLWSFGPENYRKAMEALAETPGMTYIAAAGEIGLGLLLARRAED